MSNEASNSFSIQLKALVKKLKGFVVYALNPAKILTKKTPQKWYLHLILPAVGWMCFFIQVVLDKGDMYYVTAANVLLYAFLGFVLGYVTVGLAGTYHIISDGYNKKENYL